MKLTRPGTVKPAFKAAPVKEAPKKNPNDDMDLQDIVRILTDVTKQNKDFAEGLKVLTTKVDTIVKSISDVMKANQEFCTNVLQEVSAISEYINIQPDEQAKELADTQEAQEIQEDSEVDTIEDAEAAEEGVTVEDIMSMKKGELIALIEDNDVPLDVSKYAKLGELRKALIQYLQDQYDADNEDDNDIEGEDDGVSDDTSTGADTDAGEGGTDSEEDDESDADGAEGDASNDASSDDDEEDDW